VQLGLSVIWNTAELIVICLRRNKSKGIKPGAHVACDLLIWLGGLICTGFISYEAALYTSGWRWVYQESEFAKYQYRYWLPIYDSVCAMLGSITYGSLLVVGCEAG
jgi:hypothetical protein